MLIENDALLVSGQSLLETIDRLEVAEFSTRSLIISIPLGEMVSMAEQEIEDLKQTILSERALHPGES